MPALAWETPQVCDCAAQAVSLQSCAYVTQGHIWMHGLKFWPHGTWVDCGQLVHCELSTTLPRLSRHVDVSVATPTWPACAQVIEQEVAGFCEQVDTEGIGTICCVAMGSTMGCVAAEQYVLGAPSGSRMHCPLTIW